MDLLICRLLNDVISAADVIQRQLERQIKINYGKIRIRKEPGVVCFSI
jgi:hypothetical protein